MKAALLLNPDLKVAFWQLEAINLLSEKIEFIYLPIRSPSLAGSSPITNFKLKYIVYYLLNLTSIRQAKRKIPDSLILSSKIRYLEYRNTSTGWAELSSNAIRVVLGDSPDFIYKCGLGLLAIPSEFRDIPILSHHHGDPSQFRGRPAGFYEIQLRRTAIGQIVQVLSNKLDAGRILAYGETKVLPWSYKKTLEDSFSISPYLLCKALERLKNGQEVDLIADGKNYRLPNNKMAVMFIVRLLREKLRRLFYGLFCEKKWNIAIAVNPSECTNDPLKLFECIRQNPLGNNNIPINRDYLFYADPFLLGENLIAEGLRRKDGIGELIEICLVDYSVLQVIRPNLGKQRHLSYPYVLNEDERVFIYPDSADYSRPFVLQSSKNMPGCFKTIELVDMPTSSGITDPSVLLFNGHYYMFGNLPGESHILRLWMGEDSMFANAVEHPESPIHFGPKAARGGGRIFSNGTQIYRVGQNLSYGYGDGLFLLKVELSPTKFSEKIVSEIKFDCGLHGPHTVDFNENYLCWDYYNERLSLFAGYRRLRSRILSKIG